MISYLIEFNNAEEILHHLSIFATLNVQWKLQHRINYCFNISTGRFYLGQKDLDNNQVPKSGQKDLDNNQVPNNQVLIEKKNFFGIFLDCKRLPPFQKTFFSLRVDYSLRKFRECSIIYEIVETDCTYSIVKRKLSV